jgi:hypothetical protein
MTNMFRDTTAAQLLLKYSCHQLKIEKWAATKRKEVKTQSLLMTTSDSGRQFTINVWSATNKIPPPLDQATNLISTLNLMSILPRLTAAMPTLASVGKSQWTLWETCQQGVAKVSLLTASMFKRKAVPLPQGASLKTRSCSVATTITSWRLLSPSATEHLTRHSSPRENPPEILGEACPATWCTQSHRLRSLLLSER